MIKSGKIFSFEGIDQSGKEKQSKLLFEKLKEEGEEVLYLSFPAYETDIGKLLRKFLDGEIELSTQTRHLLYTANRFEFKNKIDKAISQGKHVILNRYSESGIAYGIANGLDKSWLQNIEIGLPPADIIFYFPITPQTAFKRKPENRDRYEKNIEFLKKCLESYMSLAVDGSRFWHIIDGEKEIETIHREVCFFALSLIDQDASKIDRKSFFINSLSTVLD